MRRPLRSDRLRRLRCLRRARPGFTLVEVIVALALGTAVLLAARAILEQLADSADRLAAASTAADSAANTERVARALFERAAAADSAHPFAGGPAGVRFSSWCDVPAGWLEPCEVTALVVPADAADSALTRPDSALARLTATRVASRGRPVSVVIRTSAGDTLHLHSGVDAAEFRYLDDAAGGGHWTTGWPAGVTTPLAVGIVTPRDTTVLRIGERR